MRFLFALALLLTPLSAAAQTFLPGRAVADDNPYPTKATPTRASSTVTSGTIATANTYQSVLAASSTRLGCSIQNRSAASMRVFLGTPGAATDANSFDLPAGATFSCSAGLVVISDQISITSGTQGAGFVVSRQ